MRLLYFFIFLSISAAVFLLLNIKLENVIDLFRGRKTKEKTLADHIAVYNPKNQKPKKGFKKDLLEIQEILEATGQSEKFAKVKMASVLLALLAGLLCIVLNNIAFVPVAMLAAAIIPFIYIKMICNKYQKTIDETIEATLSSITNSYMRTEDIVVSVKENLPYIEPALKTHFETFVTEVETVNPNVTVALNNLKYKVNNPVFFDWCNRLIQCQTNRNLKHTLLPIIERMSDLRALRAELTAELVGPRNEAITMAGLVFGNIPLLYLINKDWFSVLTTTLQGKIAVALIVLICLLCGLRVWKLCQPLKYEDLEGR